jgi:RNA polymerase sigma-70 factor (ECF subfamily)
MNRPDGFPSPEEGLRFHVRLGEGDPVAPAEVCKAYLGPLNVWLVTAFPKIDPHLRQAAIDQALFDYVQQPGRYDPARGDLARFLRMAARSDLMNLLAQEQRHQVQRVPWSVVEDDQQGRYLSGREPEPAAVLQDREEDERWQAFLRSVKAKCTAAENQVLDLMMAGQRQCQAFAAALDIGHLPAAEQEREVKRVKDRIKKRLEREGQTDD